MSLLSQQIQQQYHKHVQRMSWILFSSLLLMINTVGFTFSFSLMISMAWFVLAILPTCLLVKLMRDEMTKPVVVIARRLKLTVKQTQDLRLVMGLLHSPIDDANAFEDALRDRVLTRWQEPLSKAYKVSWIVITVLVFQSALLASMVVFHVSMLDETSPTLPTVIATENADETSTDVQQGVTPTDQIATELLRMQQRLKMISQTTTDEQLQAIEEQLNQLWQRISVIASDAAATDMPVQSQLQTASHMPLSGVRSLQSQSLRQTLSESLGEDIQTLARLGARFDGPGIISRGKAEQIPTDAANPAKGRYHEYTDKLPSSSSDTVTRRIEQVPPRYRQAVARYLADLDNKARNEKAHKGVKP
ncbi:MAG: hypothetical protein CMJ19_24760 [Phycisphaeraceae bacterium]|nr:hypothetical protein [Phycisphaeraceae bacterium]